MSQEERRDPNNPFNRLWHQNGEQIIAGYKAWIVCMDDFALYNKNGCRFNITFKTDERLGRTNMLMIKWQEDETGEFSWVAIPQEPNDEIAKRTDLIEAAGKVIDDVYESMP